MDFFLYFNVTCMPPDLAWSCPALSAFAHLQIIVMLSPRLSLELALFYVSSNALYGVDQKDATWRKKIKYFRGKLL